MQYFLLFFHLFLVFISDLDHKKSRPMQFPQISALRFRIYVNTIKKSEKSYFYH